MGRRGWPPTWLPTSATGKEGGQAGACLSHGSPLKVPEPHRQLRQPPQALCLQCEAATGSSKWETHPAHGPLRGGRYSLLLQPWDAAGERQDLLHAQVSSW